MKATFCQGPYYNHSLSSSYEGPLGKIETITYGDGSKVGGHLGKDQVSIGGATILSQEFVQATHFSQMMTGLDGIMGLTLSSDHLVYRDIPNTAPVFSYFIKEGDLTGGITFGAIDTKRYGGPLLWVPILNGHSKSPSHWLKDLLCIFKGREEEKNRDVWQHWDIELVSAKIGNTDLKIPSSFTVLPDTGSSLAIFPSSEAQLINMALGMSPVMGRPDTYTIKCDSIANLPNMTFNFVTGPIVLTPFDYTYTKGGVCLSGISGGSPSNKQIVFGNVFL
jgi:saccharopepsin